MKHLVKDGQVVMSGIPDVFTRENGEVFWGGYRNRTDLHYEDGWRDEIIPPYDIETEYLGDKYYDAAVDKVTYFVKKILKPIYTLEELQARLKSELSEVMNDFVTIITRCKILYGDNNDGLNSAITATKTMKEQTVAAIDSYTDVDALSNFKIRTADVAYFKSLFDPFML